MKRTKKQKADYIPDEDFQRMMKLQMAETRKEAIEILRTAPDLTEERIQRMAQLWPEEFAELNKPGEPEKGFTELLREAHATENSTQKEAIYAKIVEQEKKRVLAELRRPAS